MASFCEDYIWPLQSYAKHFSGNYFRNALLSGGGGGQGRQARLPILAIPSSAAFEVRTVSSARAALAHGDHRNARIAWVVGATPRVAPRIHQNSES